MVALLLISIFLTVLGSRLWLVRLYGSDIPFWDQWDAEAAFLYKPLIERGIGAVDWFAAHNEHRIVLSRITSAATLFVNGQWDPLLQECWNAFFAASIAVLLGNSIVELMARRRSIGLVLVIVLIGLTAPFGFENTLAGFQSSFYYAIFLAIAMQQLCTSHELSTRRRSTLLVAMGALSLITMASGALACLAAACALTARLVFAREDDAREIAGLVVVLGALGVLGLVTTPTIPSTQALHAKDLSQFITVFNVILGWPTEGGMLVWLPFAAWCVQTILRRRIEPLGVFVVGLAAFVMLNAAAIAAGRGIGIANVTLITSRYTDVLWLAWLVNLLAVLLLERHWHDHRAAVAQRALVVFLFLGAAAVLVNAGVTGLVGAEDRGRVYALETINTRNYLSTGDPTALRDKPFAAIPHYDVDRLMTLLDDPTIRALLPAGIRSDGASGRLRWLVDDLLGAGRGMTLFGLVLFVSSIGKLTWRQRKAVR